MRWGVKKRMEFIEFRLFFEGRLNRMDLMTVFGVSVNQASTDLSQYLKAAPGNMRYNRSARSYLRKPTFKPLYLKTNSDSYLNQLRAISAGVLDKREAWAMDLPIFDTTRAPTRVVDPRILQGVLEAMRLETSLEVRYQSLSAPDPSWRWISPHSIGWDGFRWHVRAHCDRDEEYKDFLLARILDVRNTRERPNDPYEDEDWHEHVALDIGPHPGLSESQRKVVAADYGMKHERVTIRVRRAFLFYTMRRLGLDRDPAKSRPTSQHIVLLNRDAIEADRLSARARERAERE